MNAGTPTTGLLVALSGDKSQQEELRNLIGSQGHQVEGFSVSDNGLSGRKPQLLVYACRLTVDKTIREIAVLRTQLAGKPLPILCVNPEVSRSQAANLLEAGADDVIHKPFDGRVFLARLNALLRRSYWSGALGSELAPILKFDPIELNLISRTASASGKTLVLSRLEFDLLAYLVRRPGAVQSRKDILSAVWGYPEEVQTRTLDKYVESLRRKLGLLGEKIQTVHGIGYCLSP